VERKNKKKKKEKKKRIGVRVRRERGGGEGSRWKRDEAKELSVALQENPVEWLGEHVRKHVSSGNMQQRELVLLDALTDEMIAGVDMFGARVMLRIFCQGFCALFVNVERNRGVGAETKLGEYVSNP
jgi:hypothetical protein